MKACRTRYANIHELIEEQARRQRWRLWYLHSALECDTPILEAYHTQTQSLIVAGEEKNAAKLFHAHLDDLQNKQLAIFESPFTYQFHLQKIQIIVIIVGRRLVFGHGFTIMTPRCEEVFVFVFEGKLMIGGRSPDEATALQAQNFDADVNRLVEQMMQFSRVIPQSRS